MKTLRINLGNTSLSLIVTCLFLLFNLFKGRTQAAYQEFSASGQHYVYAPSYIQTSSTVRYMYNCSNKDSGITEDYIMYRKATKSGSIWNWGSPQVALAPGTTGAWDSRHVCDPEVRKGEFNYNGTTYSWVMFYLGVKLSTDTQNQVGIAFANSPEGPWIRYGGNPIVTDSRTDSWGVGQPAATSVDGKGRLLLFVTRSAGNGLPNNIERRDINLNNMSNPSYGTKKVVFVNGLTKRDGSQVVKFQGAAFAYEPSTDRMYTIKGRDPFNSDGESPVFISEELEIAYTSGNSIWSNNGTWIPDGYINSSVSGKPRNFDGGFLTDPFGSLIGGANNYLSSFSVSNTGGAHLWSYRMWGVGKSFLAPTGGSGGIGIIPGPYKLEPQNAIGKRLYAKGLVPSSNARIFSINGNSSQKWNITDVGGGYYELEPQSNLGMRLDVSGAGTTNGTNVAIWYQNGLDAQKWRFIDKGNGIYELEPKHASGKRLDVAGAGTADDTNVHLWESNNNNAQKWRLISLTSSSLVASISFAETINENNQLSGLNFYPNPTRGTLNIAISDIQSSHKLKIIDLSGSTVLDKNILQPQSLIDVSALSKGLYIIQILDKDQVILAERLLVE